ncbi:hypothetical protein AC1031_012890 [Aphanomyces cochlioides]|nr:hypothetical protein AC1031_012890 [Aphanomyces cochlioides]
MPYDREMVTGLASTDGAEVQDAVEHIMQVRQDLVQISFGDRMELSTRLASVIKNAMTQENEASLRLIDAVRSLLVTLLINSRGTLVRTVPEVLEIMLESLVLTAKLQRADAMHMKLLLFTALVMTLEVLVLPPADPLRLQIVSFITSQSATATSSSAQKQSPVELWRISPNSVDAHIVNNVLGLLPNWTYRSPLELQLYGYAHWAWYNFLLPGIVGPLLVMKSINDTNSFMLSAFLAALGLICICWKSSSSGLHDKQWQSLMQQAVLRAEAPWDQPWLALPPRDLSPPKLPKPQPQSEQTALVPKLSGASSELHPIQEDDEDDRTDSILAEQNALLSQIDPAEMFETLTKLQGILADADDVSDETRHKVQRGLDFLAATAQDDQRMN